MLFRQSSTDTHAGNALTMYIAYLALNLRQLSDVSRDSVQWNLIIYILTIPVDSYPKGIIAYL